MISPASIDVNQLDSVLLSELNNLPRLSGIYFAIDSSGNIQYIGKSNNIRQRWVGHHQKSVLARQQGIRISYLLIEDSALLAGVEVALINYFNPPLNSSVGPPITSPSGKPRVTTTVRIDPDLRDAAKQAKLNLSALLEQAIQENL